MRNLLDYLVSDRRRTIVAVLLLGIVPLVNLLSPLLVALIMLRYGPRETLILIIWAVLPLGFQAALGEFVPLLMLFTLSLLAWTLQRLQSWEITLLSAVLVGLVAETVVRLQPQPLMEFYALLESNPPMPDFPFFVSQEEFLKVAPVFFGTGYMILSVGLLMGARALQAMLFNPSGFSREFHRLRFKPAPAFMLLGMLLMSALVNFMIPARAWYFTVPLLVAGLGLIHGIVAGKKASALWLVAVYSLALLLPGVMFLIVLLALMDSWYDFRLRLRLQL